jgi:nitric oxide reductase NorD protein
MEEWVGQQWHRVITRLAAPAPNAAATVRLADMQRTLALMFRAGGGAPAVRLAPAGERGIGGPRGWLQRIGGGGRGAALAGLQDEVFALPPELAVFGTHALNRDSYSGSPRRVAVGTDRRLAGRQHRGHPRQLAASRPGCTVRGLRGPTAQRPDVARLHGDAAAAEPAENTRCAANRRRPPHGPGDVAPVWLWLDAAGGAIAGAAPPARPDPPDAAAPAAPMPGDTKRRRAEREQDERHRAPLMMFFRAESILSWGEFTKVERAVDDSDDGNALAAADDMDTLAIAPDGARSAARVRFDLDLPSAAADDRPLGPGQRLPEWDWRQRRLIDAHCAGRLLIATPAEPYSRRRRCAPRLAASGARWSCCAPHHAAPTPSPTATIDLDAWMRHRIDAAHHPRRCAARLHEARAHRAQLATLLLADLSLSTDAYATQEARVIDLIRESLFVFGEALAAGGDPFEMLGFSSVRRQNVRIQHLKGFDEGWSAAVRDRIGAIKPGYYTRMGAAIRHATQRLAARPERQRLLLILTDGKPNDLDVYEGKQGWRTRHAVQAARAAGADAFA